MNYPCELCGQPLQYFGRAGSDIFECVKCGKAWFFHDNGQVNEVVGWRAYAK